MYLRPFSTANWTALRPFSRVLNWRRLQVQSTGLRLCSSSIEVWGFANDASSSEIGSRLIYSIECLSAFLQVKWIINCCRWSPLLHCFQSLVSAFWSLGSLSIMHHRLLFVLGCDGGRQGGRSCTERGPCDRYSVSSRRRLRQSPLHFVRKTVLRFTPKSPMGLHCRPNSRIRLFWLNSPHDLLWIQL